MRRFYSYGPIDMVMHYYAPRKTLIKQAATLLTGEQPERGGHYITVWAPRQCGKTWIIRQAVNKIEQSHNFEIGVITMERAKQIKDEKKVLNILIEKLQQAFDKSFHNIEAIDQLPNVFTKKYFQKPVILILDEFDALDESLINRFASTFRDININRANQENIPSGEKDYLLHGLALIGVRSVLGIENQTGSPFNVQRSLHIPNLTHNEVKGMFQWYEKESGQRIEPQVIDRLFTETRGQPGLTCWLGELLAETFNENTDKPITMDNFVEVYAAAIKTLPNNNILNIISKADKEPYKHTVLELFKTDRKMPFNYDNRNLNYLYLNGVIDREKENRVDYYVRFASPFVQKRLFNYFSTNLFDSLGRLMEPLTDIGAIIAPGHLDIRGLMALYREYLAKNKEWLFKDVPRRSDMRVFEAVFHFNLYAYLNELLRERRGRVFPEFPTGNGKIDLLIKYEDKTYGIEIKSFTDRSSFHTALSKAAIYGKQLGLEEIYLVSFLESIDKETRKTLETVHKDPDTGVLVKPIFIETGSV